MPLHVAAAKALRPLKLLAYPELIQYLLSNQVYQEHIHQLDKNDPFVFISHKHYLAKGLTTEQRVRTTVCHYQHESSVFNQHCLNMLGKKKLVVWQSIFEDTHFNIKLEHGNDVLYEGASSLVFYYNDERVCVFSFSIVPLDILFQVSEKNSLCENNLITILITRKQPTQDYTYQKVFNKAFDRTTPAHLCMAALAGYAQNFGFDQVVGISAEAHPSSKSEYLNAFLKAYDTFWESMHGKKVSPFGFAIKLPLELSDLDDMDAKARKRAVARREHANQVTESAYNSIKGYLAK